MRRNYYVKSVLLLVGVIIIYIAAHTVNLNSLDFIS